MLKLEGYDQDLAEISRRVGRHMSVLIFEWGTWVDWKKTRSYVNRLQTRIAKATLPPNIWVVKCLSGVR